MKRTAVITAPGCEEGETLTIVDILRRAEIQCDMISLSGEETTGAHGITIRTDGILDDTIADYDMIILPGGYGGADAMRHDEKLLRILQEMNEEGKHIAVICAASLVLEEAGLLEGRRFTCYPATAEKIHQGTYNDDVIVIDNNLITSQGPATAYAFAYKLAEILGADVLKVQNRMVYFNAFDETKSEPVSLPLPVLDYPVCDKKAAVLMVEGFEESETAQIVDLLRRANILTHTFRFQENEYVHSMQGMDIKADKLFSDEVKEYDVIVVPGGRTAAAKLIANEHVLETLQYFNEHGKLIAGMCSGTTVLKAADVIEGKKVTGYTGYAEKLTGAVFCENAAVYDKNVVTSQGPATPYPFAFMIMEALGVDPEPLKQRLLYHLAGGK